jgi:adenine deaminase
MGSMPFSISGNIVNLIAGEIFPGTVEVEAGRVARIRRDNKSYATYLLPGFIDAHVHVESSLLIPSEFARLAVVHGTVATVSDPHEIANVLGMEGVDYMIENGRQVPFKFHFGAPSCVPATDFETAGARVTAEDVARLLERDEISYLSEMMNYPGVIQGDREVMQKLAHARRLGKPVDGHAPGVGGADLLSYAGAGITTDHECFTEKEALEKIDAGMKIAIREGSAARNFDDLVGLLTRHAESCMFCSDDKHADSLVVSHIDDLVRRAMRAGHDPIKVLRCASLNPVKHYAMNVGLLQVGDPADFIEVSDLRELRVLKTFIGGRKVAEAGKTLIERVEATAPNRFRAVEVRPDDLRVRAEEGLLNVIEAIDRQLVTKRVQLKPLVRGGLVQADPEGDLLKLAVINRYTPSPPAVAFVRNFGLRCGAIASSVAHDSHNIIAVGASDEAVAAAVNLVVQQRGGLSIVDGQGLAEVLPLPVAGLMSPEDGYKTAERYTRLDRLAKELGSRLTSPFMTLSFMALLVIPEVKLSDRGLFDGREFKLCPLFSGAGIVFG